MAKRRTATSKAACPPPSSTPQRPVPPPATDNAGPAGSSPSTPRRSARDHQLREQAPPLEARVTPPIRERLPVPTTSLASPTSPTSLVVKVTTPNKNAPAPVSMVGMVDSSPPSPTLSRPQSLEGLEKQIKQHGFADMGREEGPSRAEKKRPVELDDDRTEEILNQCRIGTALLFVPALDPRWKNAPVHQRSIQPHHVAKLKKGMVRKIYRTEPHRRLKVSMKLDDYQKAVAQTVAKYREWEASAEYEAITVPTEAELDRQVRDSYTKRSGKLDDFPLLVWDRAAGQAPQLDAGQHRRAAFLELMHQHLGDDIDINPGNIETTAWVCDIFDFDKASTGDYHKAARVNKEDVYMSNSAGENYCIAWQAWADLSDEEKKTIGQNKHTVAKWLEGELGLPTESGDRYNQLLKDPFWNKLAYTYCTHRFGRDSFVIFHFTDLMAQRIPSFWETYFSEQYTQLEDIFGKGRYQDITKDELDLLNSIGAPLDAPVFLQILFFPSSDDFIKHPIKGLGINVSWFHGTEFKEYKLTQPYEIANTRYTIRRPEFLSHLTEAEYIHVFERLSYLGEAVMSPSTFINQLKSVGEMTSALCLFTVFMVNPTYKLPVGANVKQLNDTDLINVIAEHCLSLPPRRTATQRAGATLDEIHEQAKKNKKTAMEFVLTLHGHVVATRSKWEPKPSTLRAEINQNVNVVMTEESICRVVDRFAHQPWREFLRMFIKAFGTNKLTGCMAYFKEDPKLLNRLSTTIKALDSEYKAVYRHHLAERFADMPVVGAPAAAKAVAIATNFATLCVEYRRVEYYAGRFEKAREMRENGADETDVREAGDNMTSQEYGRCLKRLQELSRALACYGVNIDPEQRQQGPQILPDLRIDHFRPQAARGYDPAAYQAPPSAVTVSGTPPKKRKGRSEAGEDEGELGSPKKARRGKGRGKTQGTDETAE